jgi:protein QN1
MGLTLFKENDSKKQIQHLTAQLIEKQNLLNRQQQTTENNTCETSAQQHDKDKKYMEQEKLMLGYQTENERLYSDLKQLRETIKVQQQQNEIDNQKLKIDLINKNIQIDNLKHQLVQPQQPKIIDESNEINSRRQQTNQVDDSLRDRVKQLEVEKAEQVTNVDNLKQKLEKLEEKHLKMQMNANKAIEAHKDEIRKLEQHIRMLEKKPKAKPSEGFKNLKSMKEACEAKLLKLEAENKDLLSAFDQLKLNESCFKECIKQLENQLKAKDLKKQYDSSAFKEIANDLSQKLEEENYKLKDDAYKHMVKFTEMNRKYEKASHDYEIHLSDLKVSYNTQIQALKQAHAREIEKQLNETYAKSQQISELKLRSDEQKILSAKLQESQMNIDKLKEINKLNEKEIAELSGQINELKNDLHVARLHHSPNMKHVNILNDKIMTIEYKYSKREKELQDILKSSRIKSDYDTEYEFQSNQQVLNLIRNYQEIIESKDRELAKFRCELDSMLELLQTLHRMHGN